MNPLLEISGAPEKGFDLGRRSLEAAGVGGAALAYQSLEVDTLTWTQQRGTVPPDERQPIALWRGDDCLFRGHVETRDFVYEKSTEPGYEVKAVGPMWYLAKTLINGEVTDGSGNTTARTTFQFPQGDVRGMIIRLINRATDIGLPIRIGHVDEMFVVQQRALSNCSFLSALVTLLKPLSDAAAYVDYNVEGLPTLNIYRRAKTMEPVALQLGVDDVANLRLRARVEMRPSGVKVLTATFGADGKAVFAEQVAGDSTRAQLVTISGPEIGSYVPPDNLPNVAIRTLPITGGWADAKELDSNVAGAIEQYGDLGMTPMAGDEFVYVSSSGSGSTKQLKFSPGSIRSDTGVPFDGTWQRLKEGQVVDFLKTDYGLEETNFTILTRFVALVAGGSGANVSNTLQALIDSGRVVSISGFRNFTGSASGPQPYTYYFYTAEFTVPGIRFAPVGGVRPTYPALTTIYSKAAKQFLQAPEGLAQNLYEAQNWTPWEGSVGLNPSVPWRRWTATRLNVINGSEELRTAGALIQGQSLNIQTGAVSLRCGAPARVAMDEIAGKFTASGENENLFNV